MATLIRLWDIQWTRTVMTIIGRLVRLPWKDRSVAVHRQASAARQDTALTSHLQMT